MAAASTELAAVVEWLRERQKLDKGNEIHGSARAAGAHRQHFPSSVWVAARARHTAAAARKLYDHLPCEHYRS